MINNGNSQISEQKDVEEIQQKLEDMANENCILRVVAGSHAYGTNIPSSDWDERAIFADVKQRVLLPFEKIEQIQFREDDKVYFELSKYMPLLLSQNPNVIELIWTDPKDVLFKNELGDLLLDNRHEFLSKQVTDSYVGYAMSQLKRIKGHNKWINNPQPEREPQMADYISILWNYSGDKENNKRLAKENYTAVSIGDGNFALWDNDKLNVKRKNWLDNKGNPIAFKKPEFDLINTQGLPPDVIVKTNKKLYEDGHENWKAYWSWKKNRNEKRSELEEKYGYDVKHAMHLIRLLKSGVDILEKGIVPVKRDDAAYLLDIRGGKYTYEEITKESERLSEKVRSLSEKTKLPEKPNYDLAKEIMIEVYEKQWKLSPEKKTKHSI